MTTFIRNTHGVIEKPRVAIIQACWHRDIVDQFRAAFATEFRQLDGRDVCEFEVPGAFEIPLMAKQLATSGEYAAIIAAGLVVDGGIYRHEFVASAVIDGLMRVQLDTGVPVFSGVLTPHDFTSEGRESFFREHFVLKGREAAQACASTLSHYAALSAA